MEQNEIKKLGIDGLTWSPKKVVSDERGAVKLMLKEGQFEFPVGEIYFSIVKPRVVKGWKFHQEMWQRFSVPFGKIKFVFVDTRFGSKTNGVVTEFEMGEENYGLLTVPPQIWYSFRGECSDLSVIANAASIPRTAGESESLDCAAFEFYQWSDSAR